MKLDQEILVLLGLALLSKCVCLIAPSCPALCNPLDYRHQAPPSMKFFRQEYWSGCHFLLQDLRDPGIELASPVSCDAGGLFTCCCC